MNTEKISDTIDNRIKHTKIAVQKHDLKLEKHEALLVEMKANCAIHTNKVNLLMEEIKEDVSELSDKIDKVLDKIENFATKNEVLALKKEKDKEVSELKSILEKLKEFRWQALAIGAVALWLLNLAVPRLLDKLSL